MPATLALFEADELHPTTPQGSGVAFSVAADAIDVVRVLATRRSTRPTATLNRRNQDAPGGWWGDVRATPSPAMATSVIMVVWERGASP